METVSCIDLKTCCNALVKLRCWLILAKYGASKLDIVRQLTQDAALEEYEIRLNLKKRFASVDDKFTNFMHEVFKKAITNISNFTYSNENSSTTLIDEDNNSLWLLYNIINEEIAAVTNFFANSGSHSNCVDTFNDLKNEIITIICHWPNAINNSYSNFMMTSLSEIFINKMNDLVHKHEFTAQSEDIRWLCEEIMRPEKWQRREMNGDISSDNSNNNQVDFDGEQQPQTLKDDPNCNEFWFINTTLVWNSLQESHDYSSIDEFYFHSESELVEKLSEWILAKCVIELKSAMDRLNHSITEKLGTRIYDKRRLTKLIGLSATELELYLMEAQDQFNDGFNLADGPHYYVPDIVEMNNYRRESSVFGSGLCINETITSDPLQSEGDSSSTGDSTIETGFDLLASVLQDYGDHDLNIKIMDMKTELSESCAEDNSTKSIINNNDFNVPASLLESNWDEAIITAAVSTIAPAPKINIKVQKIAPGRNRVSSTAKTATMPKIHVIGKNRPRNHDRKSGNSRVVVKTEPEPDTKFPVVNHKRRGRPRKVDEMNHSQSKNGQHKYSQENVMDCSNWISDNFFEVAGNKPAIDRARLYELYTNYCLLKLCTPVDRALFGKIIRKVFPKLRSRRLIQNQVLKYHYVGLKPKFVELEQALLNTDPTVMSQPQEIVLSFIPSESQSTDGPLNDKIIN